MPLALVKTVPATYHLAISGRREVAIPYQFISYRCEGLIASLTLNRPEQGNLIDGGLAGEIRHACQEIRQDGLIRVVVIAGTGEAFSRGREPLPPELSPEFSRELSREFSPGAAGQRRDWVNSRRVADAVAGLPVPVIVSVNGDALDHGLELALAGDLRIGAEPARFGLTDLSGTGGFPWDGGTQRLPRLVGTAWASDLILTSRIISSAEAWHIGLVNRVVPSGELARETLRLAEAIAAGGPIAARYAKEAVTAGTDLSLAQGLRLEADLNFLLHSTGDRAEGIRSFAEKRLPRFTGQ